MTPPSTSKKKQLVELPGSVEGMISAMMLDFWVLSARAARLGL